MIHQRLLFLHPSIPPTATFSTTQLSASSATPAPPGRENLHNKLGAELTIKKLSDGTITVNGEKIVRSDIITKNGVVHLFDNGSKHRLENALHDS